MSSTDNKSNIKHDEDISIFNLNKIKDKLNKNKSYLKCVSSETLKHFLVWVVVLIILTLLLPDNDSKSKNSFLWFIVTFVLIFAFSGFRNLIEEMKNSKHKNLSMYLYSLLSPIIPFLLAFYLDGFSKSTAKKFLILTFCVFSGILLLLLLFTLYIISRDKSNKAIEVSSIIFLYLTAIGFMLLWPYFIMVLFASDDSADSLNPLYYLIMVLFLMGTVTFLFTKILEITEKTVDKNKFRNECLEDSFELEVYLVALFENILYIITGPGSDN